MNKYRSHNCNELRKKDVGNNVLLSGWINKKRDHGNLLFIDLRDNYGITQCIVDKDNLSFNELEKTQLETVIKINGKVINRSDETINKDIETGEIEVAIVLAIPTVGPLVLSSVSSMDIYVASSIFMILSLVLVIGNFIADCFLALLDPRIRDMAGGAA